jgi:hypothetical protein
MADDVINTHAPWTVTRKGTTVQIVNADSGERHERSYDSVHGAICAMGRMRHQASAVEMFANSIKVERLKGYHKRRPHCHAVRSELILLVLMEQGTVSNEALEGAVAVVKERVLNGEPHEGVNELRRRISAWNKEAMADREVKERREKLEEERRERRRQQRLKKG